LSWRRIDLSAAFYRVASASAKDFSIFSSVPGQVFLTGLV
jgi:hypothetical protein